MAITLALLQDHVAAVVGEDRMGGLVDMNQIINEAGRHLYSMHEWRWKMGATATANFVQDQSYAALPSDFGQMIDVEVDNTLESTVQLTSMSEIEYLRSSTTSDPFQYYAAVSYPSQANTTSSPTVRLELWPTPGAAKTDALKYVYNRGWTELSANASVSDIPLDYESLLIRLIRAFSMDYKMNVNQAVEALENSKYLNTLKQRDGMTQPTYGAMTGGKLASVSGIYRPHGTISASG